jgi:orotate phosphoribosyltransferase
MLANGRQHATHRRTMGEKSIAGGVRIQAVATDVANLVPRKAGHFRMASGMHSDLWLDLDALLANPRRLRPHVAELARRLVALHVDVVGGPLVGGAFLAQMLAEELDVQFCYAERVNEQSEFTIAPALRNSLAGKRIAIVDDAIQAGSAVRGALADAIACGATPVALAALIVLGPSASELASRNGIPLLNLENLAAGLWNATECPLCDANVPLNNE